MSDDKRPLRVHEVAEIILRAIPDNLEYGVILDALLSVILTIRGHWRRSEESKQ